MSPKRRNVGVPIVIGVFLAAIIALALGATLGLRYLQSTDPDAATRNALSASGTVTAQRQGLDELPNSKFPTASVGQFLSYGFSDRDGIERAGEDEVSALYFQAHPVGANVQVYYLPGNSQVSVLESAMRLSLKVSRLDLFVAVALLILGGVGITWSANRWLTLKRGSGFL